MSASEKLERLDERTTMSLDLIGEGDWTPQDTLLASIPFPELIAVVKAAEGCFRIDQPSWNEVERRMAQALAALDRKLAR